jgi:NADH:ubiquinone oxidoreductase subunit 4 (subunit M)
MTWPPSILSVLVWSPAVGAVFSACLRENRQRRRAAIGFAALTLAIAGALALTFEAATGPRELRRWVPPFGLSYDLHLDGFGSLLIVWIALLGLLAITSSSLERRSESVILAAESALLGLATAGDGVLFLAFYGAGLLAVAALLGRSESVKTFLVFQSTGAALAVVATAISYHLERMQTGFPSAEIDRFSSLVTFPDFQARMFLLGAAAVSFAAPLFPFTAWVEDRELATEGKLLLAGGWSLSGMLFFVRVIVPADSGGSVSLFVTALAALSLLYAGIRSRLSRAALLVGVQGLVLLGLASSTAAGVASGRAGMLQLAIALSALALWTADGDGRAQSPASAIAIALFLPASWLILRERWSDAPWLVSISVLGLACMLWNAARTLPPLSRKRGLLLVPLLAIWTLALLAPSRFLPEDAGASLLEEE